MNNKALVTVLGAAVIAGGVFVGYKAWGHHDAVTLHVRNKPLVEVVRLIEKQTGQKICVDKKLDATVTLEVKNAALTNVLNQLAEQVGARWGRTYAVYGNELTLRRLEGVLRGESDLDTAGWTNLAPRFDSSDLSTTHLSELMKGGPGGGGDAASASGPAGGTTTTITDGDGRVKVTRTSADGKVIASDEWSAARLVLEKPLTDKLGATLPKEATRQSAAETANKVHGHAVVYYALEKPPIGGDFSGLAGMSMNQNFKRGGTNNPLSGNIRDRMEAEGRARRIEELSKGPEEQVRRARLQQEAQSPK